MGKKTSQSVKKTKPLTPKKEAAQETTPPERLRELAEQDIALARIVAKNPAAPPDLLKELTSTGDKAVRKGATANPNTPSDVLLELGGQFPENLLDNPIFDLLLLENPNLLADMPKSSLKSLLKRDFVPASFLAWAGKQEDEDLFLAVATNPETSRAVLEKLTNHPNEAVQQAAKLHVNWAGEMTEGWEEIAQEEIDKGKLKVVKKYQPYDLFLYQRGLISEEKLNVPADKSGREKMASNPNTPVPLLEKLALDKNKDVRCELASNPNTPVPLLEKLALDKNKDVRCHVASNPKVPISLLEKLALDKNKDVRCHVAFNPKVPISLLEKLALDKNKDVRCHVAFKPEVPIPLLEKLALDKNNWVRLNVALNPKTSVPILIPLLEKLALDKDSGVRFYVASNPNTPVPLLEKLALDKNKDVREKVASNPNTPVRLRENFDKDYWLSGDIVAALFPLVEEIPLEQSVAIRHGVASNPNTPSSVLEKLATDVDKDVRQKVVNRITQSPKEILESFSIAPILEQFCKSSQPSFHRLLAFLDPEAPVAALAKYFRSLAWIERYAIAQNPSTPDKTLTYLAKDANRVVRAAAKANQEQRTKDMLLMST